MSNLDRDKSCDNNAVIVDKLMRLFIHRTDTYAVQSSDGTYRRVESPLTKDVVSQHLEGKITIGVYQVNPADDTVLWICLDIDPGKVSDTENVAKRLYCWVTKAYPKEAVWLEASRHPDPSYHLWLFFIEPIPADVARWLGKCWNDEAGHPMVEVFPKQDSVKGGYGNLVKFPLGLHREHGKWSRWLDLESLQPLPDEVILRGTPARLTKEQITEIRGRISSVNLPDLWERHMKSAGPQYVGPDPSCISKLLNGLEEGFRNEGTMRLGSYWLHVKRLDELDVWNRLKEWNLKNRPPLPDGELESAFGSLVEGGYAYGCHSMLTFCEKPLECPLHKFDTIAEVEEVVETCFPGLSAEVEAGLSVAVQQLIEDITLPAALMFVDVPSTWKSTLISMFKGWKGSYYTDNFTPRAFVSHSASVPREKLAEVDLLPKIKGKVFLISDLAPVWGTNREDLVENLGIITRVLDGEGYSKDSGVHGQRGYSGDYMFCWLGGTVPVPHKTWDLIGKLGSRLYFLDMHSHLKDEYFVEMLVDDKSYVEKVAACRKAVHSFLGHLSGRYPQKIKWNRPRDADGGRDVLEIIVKLGRLIASLRGSIPMNWDNKGVPHHDLPIIERPDRAIQWLYNFARGHALACGREQISREELPLLCRIAQSSAPYARVKVFKALIGKRGSITVRELRRALGCSRKIAYIHARIMEALGIVEVITVKTGNPTGGRPEHLISLKPDYRWFASKEFGKVTKWVPVYVREKKNAPKRRFPKSR